MICIDEIQRKPGLFSIIRSIVDEWGENGKFLVLGSASRDLLKQSAESLAGRISYNKLGPFLYSEVYKKVSLERYIERGGFPKSLLAEDTGVSIKWREDFIITFLERDLMLWAGFSPETMRRMWKMLAHVNGQTVNFSMFGKSLGVSNVTVHNYIDLLQGTYMLEVLPPYISNAGKRLVKAPKVYVADSGITTVLLGLRDFSDISAHPALGSIWEQIVLTNLKGHFPYASFYYYRTSAGAEVDLVMEVQNKVFVIVCKSSVAPTLSKGNYFAIEDINPIHTFIVCPAKKGWPMKKGIDVITITELYKKIIEKFK